MTCGMGSWSTFGGRHLSVHLVWSGVVFFAGLLVEIVGQLCGQSTDKPAGEMSPVDHLVTTTGHLHVTLIGGRHVICVVLLQTASTVVLHVTCGALHLAMSLTGTEKAAVVLRSGNVCVTGNGIVTEALTGTTGIGERGIEVTETGGTETETGRSALESLHLAGRSNFVAVVFFFQLLQVLCLCSTSNSRLHGVSVGAGWPSV